MLLSETSGGARNRSDILGHAKTCVLLQPANSWGGIQMVKACILCIADILVVNKADAPGSDKMMRGLAKMVAHAARADQWPVPVVKTEAMSGEGIERLLAAIEDNCG